MSLLSNRRLSFGRLRLAVALVAVSPVLVNAAIPALVGRRSIIDVLVRRNVYTHDFGRPLDPMGGEVPVVPFVTASGLVVNVPARTYDPPPGMPNACWRAPIPCTPNPAPNLRLRRPGDLASGFAVDGGWQMQDFPYYWRDTFMREWRARHSVSH
jgi:hypothetical protein